MCCKLQQKGGIYELNFGYNVKMEVYANSSSDISELGERDAGTLMIEKIGGNKNY